MHVAAECVTLVFQAILSQGALEHGHTPCPPAQRPPSPPRTLELHQDLCQLRLAEGELQGGRHPHLPAEPCTLQVPQLPSVHRPPPSCHAPQQHRAAGSCCVGGTTGGTGDLRVWGDAAAGCRQQAAPDGGGGCSTVCVIVPVVPPCLAHSNRGVAGHSGETSPESSADEDQAGVAVLAHLLLLLGKSCMTVTTCARLQLL